MKIITEHSNKSDILNIYDSPLELYENLYRYLTQICKYEMFVGMYRFYGMEKTDWNYSETIKIIFGDTQKCFPIDFPVSKNKVLKGLLSGVYIDVSDLSYNAFSVLLKSFCDVTFIASKCGKTTLPYLYAKYFFDDHELMEQDPSCMLIVSVHEGITRIEIREGSISVKEIKSFFE